MKKKIQTRMAIFMLLLMLGNFFMGISTPIVKALTTGEVYNYSLEVKNKIESVKGKINISKEDNLYLTDNAYIDAINYLTEEVTILENNLTTQLNVLDLGVSLRTLINNCFTSKFTEYNTYMIGDSTVIDVNSINDIKYLNESAEKITLLTKVEIESAIKSYYLESLYNKVLNLDNNYNSVLDVYRDSYNAVISKIDNDILDLDTKKSAIEDYEQAEVTLLNNPDMMIESISIYDLIEQAKITLENEKIGLTISNITLKNTTIDSIYDEIILSINTFWLQNKTYLELGLDTEISVLEDKYVDADTCLNTWFSDISDYKNDNYANYKDNLDLDLINCYKNIINLDKKYEELETKLDIYVERKPSDTDSINTLMANINNYREYLNKEKVLNQIDSLVELLKSENEDTIDLLRNFLSIDELALNTKDKINEAKYAFYPLSIIDDNYNLIIRKNYLVIENVIGTLTKEEILAIIDYDFNYEFVDNNLVLYDRDDNELLKYNIIFKGDANSDNKVDNADLETLKNIILTIKDIKEEDLDKYDFNNDNQIDINDLTLLNKSINNLEEEGITTNANLEIERLEKDNLIYYNVYLKTDGIVQGFDFKLDFSKDLIFNSYSTSLLGINVDDLSNPSKILGYGTYKNNDLLVSLVFSKEDSIILKQTELNLTSLILVLDNYQSLTFNKLASIYTNPVKEEQVKQEQTKEEVIIKQLVNEEVNEKVKEDTTSNNEEKETDVVEEVNEKEALGGNIIKIIIVVLLGTVIIYLLNKNDKVEEVTGKSSKSSKEVKKSDK